MASKLNNKHPLEARLEKWDETQFDLKMETFRRTVGADEPIRRCMELEVVKATDMMASRNILGFQTSAHNDILMNNDTSVSWEEVYPDHNSNSIGNDLKTLNVDIHAELAKKMGL